MAVGMDAYSPLGLPATYRFLWMGAPFSQAGKKFEIFPKK
jgi:hypothetical protein